MGAPVQNDAQPLAWCTVVFDKNQCQLGPTWSPVVSGGAEGGLGVRHGRRGQENDGSCMVRLRNYADAKWLVEQATNGRMATIFIWTFYDPEMVYIVYTSLFSMIVCAFVKRY